MNNSQTPDFKTVLEKDGVLAQLPLGTSMLPMLKQKRDTVVIEKLTKKPKVNDVVLYQRKNKDYVLHRIIKIKNDSYVIRGDNCFYNEYDITDNDIIGILSGFYKDEKYVDCSKSIFYKFYVFIWRSSYYLRFFFRKTHIYLAKIKHLIFK